MIQLEELKQRFRTSLAQGMLEQTDNGLKLGNRFMLPGQGTVHLLESEKFEDIAEGFQEQVQECGEVDRMFLLGFLGRLRGAYGDWEGSKASFLCSVLIFKENKEVIQDARLVHEVSSLSLWPLSLLSCLQDDLETGIVCYEVLQHLCENDQYTTEQLQLSSLIGRMLVLVLNAGGEEGKTALTILNNLRQYARICGKWIDSKECVKAAFQAFGLAAEVASWKMRDLDVLEEIYGEVSLWAQNLSEHEWERGFLDKLRKLVLAYNSGGRKFVLACYSLFVDSLKQLVDGVDYSAYGTESFEAEWQYMLPFADQVFYWRDRLVSGGGIYESQSNDKSQGVKTMQLDNDWTDFCAYLGHVLPDTERDVAVQSLEKARNARKRIRDGPWNFPCESTLAGQYLACGQLQEAIELYDLCPEINQCTTHLDFIIQSSRTHAMLKAGYNEKAKEIINSAIQRVGEVLPCDWELKAYLLAQAGEIKSGSGDYKDAVADWERALKICVGNKFRFTTDRCPERMIISFSNLILLLGSSGHTVSARKVHASVAPFMKKKEVVSKYTMSRWAVAENHIWTEVGNLEAIEKTNDLEAEDLLNSDFSDGDLEAENHYDAKVPGGLINPSPNRDPKRSTMIMLRRAQLEFIYGHINKGFSTLRALEEKENKMLGLTGGGSSTIGLLHLHRERVRQLLLHTESMDLVLQELDKAEKHLEQIRLRPKSSFNGEIYLADLYRLRYEAEWRLGNLPGCLLLLDKIQQLVPVSRYSLRAWVHHTKASVMRDMNRITDAVAEAEIAASICITLQSHLGREEMQDPEKLWVSILSNTLMKPCLQLNEKLWWRTDPQRALIWAERKHMRYYMDRIQSSSTIAEFSSIFDRSYEVGRTTVHQTVRMCGDSTVLVKYSYHEERELLFLYVSSVVASHGPQHDGLTAVLTYSYSHNLREFFKPHNSDLKTFVRVVRDSIRKGNAKEKETIKMLAVLHTLLVKPAKECLKRMGVTNRSNWIFMPQGCLSLIPFHALYDEVDKKFLIEQVAVGIAPSFRALHHCFYRQWLCDKSTNLRKVFVAGNPNPMGGGKGQLQGAEEEVREVAAMLDVEPCVGTHCTKEAVLQGLCGSSLVLLATHGMVEPPYSRGALILKGLKGKGSGTLKAYAREVVDDVSEPVMGASTMIIGDMFSENENLEISRSPSTSRAPKINEVLTAEEITNLEGGIPGGLVVLSACRTAMGIDTAEGLLGLPRAVLQAGAAATIATLFPVADYSTKTLITDMFREMKEQGVSAMHALRHAMLKMIKAGKDIFHWAPLTLIGSPTLTLAKTVKTLPHTLKLKRYVDDVMRDVETPSAQSDRYGFFEFEFETGKVTSDRTEQSQTSDFPVEEFTFQHVALQPWTSFVLTGAAAKVRSGGSDSLLVKLEVKEDDSDGPDLAIGGIHLKRLLPLCCISCNR